MKWIGYVDRKTFLHCIDPRIKIIWFVVMTLFVVAFRNPIVLAVLLGSSLVLWKMAGILDQIGFLMKRLSPLLILSFLTWLLLGAFKDGQGDVLWSLGGFTLEFYDVEKAVVSVIRIFLMVSVFFTVILTTDFSEMIYGLRSLGFPYKGAFMVGLVFQIIPLVISEFQIIADAQRSRGLELDKGGLIARIKNYSAILFPLFIRALHSGQNLALSMHVYRLNFSRKRSNFKRLKLTGADVRFMISFVLLWISMVIVGVFDPLNLNY